ncbi:MAG: helix-turn-helix domain-containing protein [Pseudomonadota bacterium]|nr:helix-turn-helix domain-containing protein [Pseudomonadota bacterium]
MSREAIKRAVKIAGSQKALADGIANFLNRETFSQQTVSYWIKRGTAIEAEYWPAIEHVTHNQVTRRDLRPDVFAAA